MRLTAALVFVAALCIPSSAPAGAVEALGGRTTFTQPGRTGTIHIPADIEVAESTGRGRVPGLAVRGRGKLVALVATAVSGESDRPTFVFGRLRDCENRRCSQGEDFEFAHRIGTTSVSIPAGDYRVYLVADDPSARVTLTAAGLSGRRTLALRDAARATVNTPTVRTHLPATNAVYSNGDVYEFGPRGGIVFSALELEGGPWVAGEYGTCIYEEVPPGPVAFAPGCPLGLSISVVDAVVRTETDRIGMSFAVFGDAGEWGFGSFYEAAAAIDHVEASGFSIAID